MTATDDARATHEATAAQVVETGRTEVHHDHRDVSGGWLRPAVFGVNDGLVSNFALVAGVAGASADSGPVVVAGLVGLVGGAISMASGEYVSVASERESVLAEVEKERLELEVNGPAEQAELAGSFRARGVDADLADARRGADPRPAARGAALPRPRRARAGPRRDPRRARGPPPGPACCASPPARWCRCCRTCWGSTRCCWPGCSRPSRSSSSAVLTARVTARGAVFTAGRQLLIGVGAAVVTYGLGDLVGARV